MPGDCFRTYFDAATHGPEWWFPAVGLGFIALGVAMFVLVRVRRGSLWKPIFIWAPRYYRIFSIVFLGFAIIWTLIASLGVFGDYFSTWLDERQGHVAVVEGPVENFHPMPASGHDLESFTVGGVHFAYSDYVVTAGFNQTSSHGGPMREGLRVRITYRGSPDDAEIVKLEIACIQPPPPATPMSPSPSTS